MVQPQQILAPEAQFTRFQAQRKLGLLAPLDYTFMVLIGMSWMTLGFWRVFGNPTAMNLVAVAIVNILLIQFWVIVLIYRILVFLLDIQADINLMPEAAARIVLGFWEGRRK